MLCNLDWTYLRYVHRPPLSRRYQTYMGHSCAYTNAQYCWLQQHHFKCILNSLWKLTASESTCQQYIYIMEDTHQITMYWIRVTLVGFVGVTSTCMACTCISVSFELTDKCPSVWTGDVMWYDALLKYGTHNLIIAEAIFCKYKPSV